MNRVTLSLGSDASISSSWHYPQTRAKVNSRVTKQTLKCFPSNDAGSRNADRSHSQFTVDYHGQSAIYHPNKCSRGLQPVHHELSNDVAALRVAIPGQDTKTPPVT